MDTQNKTIETRKTGETPINQFQARNVLQASAGRLIINQSLRKSDLVAFFSFALCYRVTWVGWNQSHPSPPPDIVAHPNQKPTASNLFLSFVPNRPYTSSVLSSRTQRCRKNLAVHLFLRCSARDSWNMPTESALENRYPKELQKYSSSPNKQCTLTAHYEWIREVPFETIAQPITAGMKSTEMLADYIRRMYDTTLSYCCI